VLDGPDGPLIHFLATSAEVVKKESDVFLPIQSPRFVAFNRTMLEAGLNRCVRASSGFGESRQVIGASEGATREARRGRVRRRALQPERSAARAGGTVVGEPAVGAGGVERARLGALRNRAARRAAHRVTGSAGDDDLRGPCPRFTRIAGWRAGGALDRGCAQTGGDGVEASSCPMTTAPPPS